MAWKIYTLWYKSFSCRSRKVKIGCLFEMRSFTLLELLVVVLIIGILVSVGVPIYRNTVKKIEESEAKSMLKMIQIEEKIVRLESANHVYVNCTDTSDCNTRLYLELISSRWNYSVFGANNTNFCAVANDSAAVSFHINATDNASAGALCP